MINRTVKKRRIADLKDRFQKAEAAFLVNCIGLPAGAVTDLRKNLRSQDSELTVVKNTLARLVLQGEGGKAGEGAAQATAGGAQTSAGLTSGGSGSGGDPAGSAAGETGAKHSAGPPRAGTQNPVSVFADFMKETNAFVFVFDKNKISEAAKIIDGAAEESEVFKIKCGLLRSGSGGPASGGASADAGAETSGGAAPEEAAGATGGKEASLAEDKGAWNIKALAAKDISELAKLPPLDILRGHLLALLSAPQSRFVRTLNEAPSRFVRLLDSYRQKNEK